MASILNTDLGELYDQWNQRVAFNEGYQAQKITEARDAGRDAFHLGVDRAQARDNYFESRDQRVSEAQEFLQPSDVSLEVVDIEPIDEITDGEETLGMESVVANETDDLPDDDYDERLAAAGCYDLDDIPPFPHEDGYHDYLHSTRDVGEDFVGYHEWHMDNYGDFGIR